MDARERYSEALLWAGKAHPMLRPAEAISVMVDWMDKRLRFLRQEVIKLQGGHMGKITDEQLENWFTYHNDPAKAPAYKAINDAALAFAKVVRDNTPASADATCAIRHIRDARMTANAAVACDGL